MSVLQADLQGSSVPLQQSVNKKEYLDKQTLIFLKNELVNRVHWVLHLQSYFH